MMDKKEFRKMVRARKSAFSERELVQMSEQVCGQLERHPLFERARTVLMYWSLPDEVSTHAFIVRWAAHKRILLPCIHGDELELRGFVDERSLAVGAGFAIPEPTGALFADYAAIDLVVVPGMAFDVGKHRLGRGRGFYDRLLTRISCPKIGVCFPFQHFTLVPIEPHDVAMDDVVCGEGSTN